MGSVSVAAAYSSGTHMSRTAVFNSRALGSLRMATLNAAEIYDGQYAAELRETAAKMVLPGKGLLACDESMGTVGTRLVANGMENTEENRQIWRNLLFTTPGISEYISGAILFEETLYQSDPEGKPFVDVLNANGIIPGIKVDTGLRPLCGGGENEKLRNDSFEKIRENIEVKRALGDDLF